MTILMDPDAAIELAETYGLTLTIRPDGTIFGDPVDVERLRVLYQEHLQEHLKKKEKP
jgi:hypothetical protein